MRRPELPQPASGPTESLSASLRRLVVLSLLGAGGAAAQAPVAPGAGASSPMAPAAAASAPRWGPWIWNEPDEARLREALARGEVAAALKTLHPDQIERRSLDLRREAVRQLQEGRFAEGLVLALLQTRGSDGLPPRESAHRLAWRRSLGNVLNDRLSWALDHYGTQTEARQQRAAYQRIACGLGADELRRLFPEPDAAGQRPPVLDPAAGQSLAELAQASSSLVSGLAVCARRQGQGAQDRHGWALLAAQVHESLSRTGPGAGEALALRLFARTLQPETAAQRAALESLRTGLTAEQGVAAEALVARWRSDARTAPGQIERERELVAEASAAPAPGPATTPADWPDCSLREAPAPRRPDQPVDDFDGLRPGMTLDAALRHAACSERARKPESRAAARYRSRVNRLRIDGLAGLLVSDYLGRQVRTHTALVIGRSAPPRARPGFDYGNDLFEGLLDVVTEPHVQWSFASFGDQSREKVLAFTRSEHFSEDQRPLLSAMADAVRQKWGAPHWVDDGVGATDYRWAFDLKGEPLSLDRGRLRCVVPLYYTQHTDHLSDYENARRAGCGLTLTVRMAKMPDQQRVGAFYFGLRDNRAGGFALFEETLSLWRHARGEALRDAAPPPKF